MAEYGNGSTSVLVIDNVGSSKASEINKLRAENRTLLDNINSLKLQCKTSDDEVQNLREKLTCLKVLVKR